MTPAWQAAFLLNICEFVKADNDLTANRYYGAIIGMREALCHFVDYETHRRMCEMTTAAIDAHHYLIMLPKLEAL